MTAQINDIFRYNGLEYSVVGISAGPLFDPTVFDLRPSIANTSCWRGYQVIYFIHKMHLIVADLFVNLVEDNDRSRLIKGPMINGVKPKVLKQKFDLFNNYYKKLNYHLDYTGGLLLANGFNQNLYVHMGFHPAWKYKEVIELIFENGVLSQKIDRSEKMAEIRRGKIDSGEYEDCGQTSSKSEILKFIKRVFDQSYTRDS